MAWGTIVAITVPLVLAVGAGTGYYVFLAERTVDKGAVGGRGWRVSRVRTNGPLSVGYIPEVDEAQPGFAQAWRRVGEVIYGRAETAKAAALERIAQLPPLPAPGPAPVCPTFDWAITSEGTTGQFRLSINGPGVLTSRIFASRAEVDAALALAFQAAKAQWPTCSLEQTSFPGGMSGRWIGRPVLVATLMPQYIFRAQAAVAG